MKIRRTKPEIVVTIEDSTFTCGGTNPNVLYERQREFTQYKAVKGSDSNERVEEVQHVKLMVKLFCDFVTAWNNIQDENGNDLVCNMENKELFASEYLEYASRVVNEAIEQRMKVSEANSGN